VSGFVLCRQTDIGSDPCDNNGHGFETVGSKLTARARLGVLANPWLLLYGTGGAAWGQIETTLSQICGSGCGPASLTSVAVSSSASDTRLGWVAGVGAEAMLSDHWSLRGEWLHVDLGTVSNAVVDGDQS
jgi:outer membrane immunogenic protein